MTESKDILKFTSTAKIQERKEKGEELARQHFEVIRHRRQKFSGPIAVIRNIIEKKHDIAEARSYAAQKTWAEYRGKTDAATQLLNHRGFEEALRSNLEKARGKYRLMLIGGDLDFFKLVNDKYGHLAGDAFLGKAGRTIKSILRKDDIAGRPGGEEFMVLALPSKGNDRRNPNPPERPDQILLSALHITERLRRAISEITIQVGKEVLCDKTMSFGITYSTGNDTPEMIKDRVDAALYLAKQHGRNCIVIATSLGNETGFDIVGFPLHLDDLGSFQDLGFTDIGRIRNDLLYDKEGLMNNMIKAK